MNDNKTPFVIGKNDTITYKLSQSTGEADMFIDSAEGEGRQVVRFLDAEALDITKEALERMQVGMKMGLNKTQKARLAKFPAIPPE